MLRCQIRGNDGSRRPLGCNAEEALQTLLELRCGFITVRLQILPHNILNLRTRSSCSSSNKCAAHRAPPYKSNGKIRATTAVQGLPYGMSSKRC